MANQMVQIESNYNAPVLTVWEALTVKDRMKQWYFDVGAFTPEVGFEFKFTGQGKKGEKYIHLCEVKEVIPQEKLSYSWQYEGLPGYSTVTFELFPAEDKTGIKLTHEGLESFGPNGSDFAVESFLEGWNIIIEESLKEFVEK